MSIDRNPGSPLRHVATFNSSGTFTPPPGTNLAFVSVVGAGSGGYGSSRYGVNANGFVGGVAGAYVQVIGGSPHVVTVGAGGAGSNQSTNNPMIAPGTGGTTSFDGRLTITGAGGNTGSRYSGGSAINSSATGATTLTTINPGATALISTGTITSQNSGGGAAGIGSPNAQGSTPRYQQGQTSGFSGGGGAVHVYV
jgi:hypothetical protein